MAGNDRESCELPLYIVDAFTDEAFSGNPAAVCLVHSDLELNDEKLQKIAAEMNLSETAFVQPNFDKANFTDGSLFKLRWFTPTNEVALCGHATIASAAVLFFVLNNSSEKIIFETMSGPLITRRKDRCICMDFPLNKPLQQDKEEFSSLLEDLKSFCLTCIAEHEKKFAVLLVAPAEWIHSVHYSTTTKKLLVRLKDDKSRSDLENLKPEISKMMPTDNTGKVKGIIVTIIGCVQNGQTKNTQEKQYDFLSRYFAPWNGIPEDPVTGSAHTVLAPYWSNILKKNDLFARQCSPRGGDVTMSVRDNDVRVDLSGNAKIVLKGTLMI